MKPGTLFKTKHGFSSHSFYLNRKDICRHSINDLVIFLWEKEHNYYFLNTSKNTYIEWYGDGYILYLEKIDDI